MTRSFLPVALVAVVVLAGCSSLVGAPATTPPTTTDGFSESPTTTTSTVDTTPTAESDTSREETQTVTETPRPPDNPWRAERVTLVLDTNGHDETDYEQALQSAVAYWNDNMLFANYTVELVYPNATAPADIVVEVRSDVGTCGYEQSERFLGCAPLLTTERRASRPVIVQVEAGYNQRGTRSIMIHELGHVLGVRHGEPPREYMEENDQIFEVEQPDATERAYPWQTTTFEFYAATDQLPADDRETAREQVGHVVEYYSHIASEDADVPSNVTVRWAANRSDANVVVTFPETLPCSTESGSCSRRSGFDPDGDGAIEYYTETEIFVSGVSPRAIGWHTGYMFGLSLGIDESNLPAPFQRTTRSARVSDWWADDT